MSEELTPKRNGWSDYEKLVLFRLTNIETRLQAIEDEVSSFKAQITLIKFKQALVGSVAGVVGGGVITGVIQWMTS